MKILMPNFEFPPIGGGAGKAQLNILHRFAGRKDISIDVLTSAPTSGFRIEKLADNITIYKVGIHKKNLHYWRKLEIIEWLFKAGRQYKIMVKENNYDLAHAFFAFPTGWLCYRYRRKLPYIISLRGSDVPGKHARFALDYKLLAPLFRKIWHNASALIACSNGLKQRALQFSPDLPIDVIPNAVDTAVFSAPERDFNKSNITFLTVGRLSPTKRFDLLIDAFGLLCRKRPDIRLEIVGGGSLRKQLSDYISSNGLSDFIKLTGRIDSEQMPNIYRNADIFISATMQEGMSNAMLEAMAAGLPIITTTCEGTEELLKANGIIVDQATAAKISEAMELLLNDRAALSAMSSAALLLANKFTWQSVADDYFKIYKRLI